MADTNPLDATFFAFRKRERGGVLFGASVAVALGFVVLVALFVAALWSVIGPLIGWYGDTMSAVSKDPSTATPMAPPAGLFLLIPAYFVFLFFAFLLMAAYEAACLKWMIRGESDGLFALSLGADTWRVYSTYWLWFGVLMVTYFVMFLLIALLAVIGAASGDPMLAGGLALLGMMVFCLVWLYFAVRLAPAAAASIGRRRFSFFSAWTVTRGRFWALFGAFLLIVLMLLVAGVIHSTLFFGAMLGAVFANLDMSTLSQDPDAVSRAYLNAIMSMFTSPTSIALLALAQLIGLALNLVAYVLFFGVNARAVQAALEEGKIAPVTA